MQGIKRRHFLEFAGATLATLGLSQLDIQRQSLRYAKAIAANTNRKLALLIGINEYSFSPLAGCITDVYLQKELLINRFGFNEKDILLVTDESEIQPTREGILQAWEEHLIKQAKPGDIVVFHFSGHGSRVIDPSSKSPDELNSTFVPIDREQSNEGEKRVVSDIMGRTLFLLMSAVNTENFTAVLDSCHSGGGKRGNLKVRAITGKNDYPNEQELAYQQQWLSKLKMSPEEFQRRREAGIAKGVVIASAREDQYAADAPFDGFSAGAFSYIMTQYLWQDIGQQNAGSVVANISRNTTRISGTGQIPEYEAAKGKDNQSIYFIEPEIPPAEAVITNIQEDQVECWLGGINPQSFAAFDQGAVFSLIDTEGNNLGIVQLESRNGLTGSGKLLESQKSAQRGLLLQEQARTIPDDLSLNIGLDDSLAQDTNQARQALQQIKRIKPVALGKGEVHYIFGRMTNSLQQELQQAQTEDIPPIGSLGLYGQALDVIPGSFGSAGESITEAVKRLQSKLRSLLAARLVKLTLNTDSSRLKVSASMKAQDGELLAEQFTARAGSIGKTDVVASLPVTSKVRVENGVTLIPIGTRVQFQIENQENDDLYVTVLVIDPEGTMIVIFPNSWADTADSTLIKAKETRLIPDPGKDVFKLTVGKPLGMVEVLIIASYAPLTDALKALQSIAQRGSTRSGPVALGDDSTSAIDGLLVDLDRSTRGSTNRGNTRSIYVEYEPGVRAIDTSKLAAMSITFKAVES